MSNSVGAKKSSLKIRLAEESDCRFLWELANDPSVRAQSFSTDPIPWENHINWFNKKLNDKNTIILIALDEHDESIGMRRFDLQDDKSVLASVIIKKEHRNKGYGTTLIEISNRFLFNNYDVEVHNAYIKPNNHSSIKAFKNVGYTNQGIKKVNEEDVLHLTFTKKQV